MRISQGFVSKLREGICIRKLSEYSPNKILKNNKTKTMILQTKFPSYHLSNKKILDTHYLNELGAAYLYELITDTLPAEVNGLEYNNDLFEYLENNCANQPNSDKKYNFELISLYCWNRSNWNNDLEIDSEEETRNYWLYDRTKNLLIKLCKNVNFIDLSVASTSLKNIEDFISYIKKFVHTKQENEIGVR